MWCCKVRCDGLYSSLEVTGPQCRQARSRSAKLLPGSSRSRGSEHLYPVSHPGQGAAMAQIFKLQYLYCGISMGQRDESVGQTVSSKAWDDSRRWHYCTVSDARSRYFGLYLTFESTFHFLGLALRPSRAYGSKSLRVNPPIVKNSE
jgi:hypothetical protein